MKSITDIQFYKVRVNDIPALICTDGENSPKPLVIFSHGFQGKKENWKEHMKELAQLGYYTVAIDNRFHGERNNAGFSTFLSMNGKIDFSKVLEAIKGNADDVVLVLDFFTAKTEIDKNRIAMVGMSMGGFTTFRTVVIDNRIKVAVPIIASPVWEDLPGDMVADTAIEIKSKLYKISKEFSPSNFIDKFYPTALFMQAGSKDIHFDVNKLKKFYEDIKQYYINDTSKLELIIYEGIEHEFTKEMWDNAKAWLKLL